MSTPVATNSRTNVVWYVVPRVLSKLWAALFLPLYTRLLTQDELGLALVALATSGVLGLIVAPGIEAVYLRWVYRSRQGADEAVGTVTAIHLMMLGIAVGALILARPLVTVVLPGVPTRFYDLIVVSAILSSAAAPIRAEWRAYRHVDRLAAVETGQALLSAATVFTCLVPLHLGGISLLAGDVTAGLVLLPVSVRRIARNAHGGWNSNSARVVLPMALSGLPLGVSIWALASLDRILLNRFRGPEAVAVYGVAYQVVAVVMLVSIVLDKEWEVVVFEYGSIRSAPSADAEVQRLWSLSLSLFLTLASALAVFATDVVRIWLGPRYAASAVLIPWILIVAVLKVPFSLLIHLARARDHASTVTIGSILAFVIFVGANSLFIPRWGPMGAVWAAIGAYACTCTFWFSRNWSSYRIEPVVRLYAVVAAGSIGLTTIAPGTTLARVVGVLLLLLAAHQSLAYWRYLGAVGPAHAVS